MVQKIKYELEEGAHAPTRAYAHDAGLDLYANEDVILSFGSPTFVHTGVHMLIPEGYVGLICPRSGLTKQGKVAEIGVIDAGFTGEIGVTMRLMNAQMDEKGNLRPKVEVLDKGSRIAQIVILPIAVFEPEKGNVSGTQTERGQDGFGSTGK